MPDVWSKHFGFVPQATGQPLLVGETGGTLRGRDRQWAQTVIDWYLHNKIAGIFWYALNPNSDDTGGLLRADWETPEKEKLALLARMPATQISSLHELVPSIRIKSTPSPPPPAPKPPPPPPPPEATEPAPPARRRRRRPNRSMARRRQRRVAVVVVVGRAL